MICKLFEVRDRGNDEETGELLALVQQGAAALAKAGCAEITDTRPVLQIRIDEFLARIREHARDNMGGDGFELLKIIDDTWGTP